MKMSVKSKSLSRDALFGFSFVVTGNTYYKILQKIQMVQSKIHKQNTAGNPPVKEMSTPAKFG